MSIPLAACIPGNVVKVKALNFDRRLLTKLQSLGMYLHCQMSVIHRVANGNIVVAIGGTRMALDASLAQQVMVVPV